MTLGIVAPVEVTESNESWLDIPLFWQHLHGKMVQHPFTGRLLPIIVDPMVEQDMETGEHQASYPVGSGGRVLGRVGVGVGAGSGIKISVQ